MKLRLTETAFFLFCAGLSCATIDEGEDSSEYGVVEGDVGTNCTCGIANKEDQRIVGGEEAKKNEYPMIAELSVQGYHMCGGTIITKKHVVTAAHCASFSKTLDPLPKDMLGVYVGIHEVKGARAFEGGQYFAIEEFITHPNYHYKNKDHVIAVILLDDEIDFNSHNVAPACLPVGNEDIIGDKLKVLGWGLPAYRADAGTQVLMKVNIKAVTHNECAPIYKYYNVKTNICMFTQKKDACQGDSGGPLLWRDPETNRYVLVAVTSFGRNCGKWPAVNANVTYFLPWIQSVISATDPKQKTCAKLTSLIIA
uniref:Serine protease n=1 Tax=Panstrongylus megistus TaxID=65343 RepID=D7NZI4_9HEMI|nr:serine protease [Panstrongylus megistus]